jgi:hypothetical protein
MCIDIRRNINRSMSQLALGLREITSFFDHFASGSMAAKVEAMLSGLTSGWSRASVINHVAENFAILNVVASL